MDFLFVLEESFLELDFRVVSLEIDDGIILYKESSVTRLRATVAIYLQDVFIVSRCRICTSTITEVIAFAMIENVELLCGFCHGKGESTVVCFKTVVGVMLFHVHSLEKSSTVDDGIK